MAENTYTRRQFLAGSLAGAVGGAVAATGVQSLFGSAHTAQYATSEAVAELENRVLAGEISQIEVDVLRYVANARPNTGGVSNYVQETQRAKENPITVTAFTLNDVLGSSRIEVGIVKPYDRENYLKISFNDNLGTSGSFEREYVSTLQADRTTLKGSRVNIINRKYGELSELHRMNRALIEYKIVLSEIREFFANQTTRQ